MFALFQPRNIQGINEIPLPQLILPQKIDCSFRLFKGLYTLMHRKQKSPPNLFYACIMQRDMYSGSI